jgi:DNA-binding transcriptional ArsR family regulator
MPAPVGDILSSVKVDRVTLDLEPAHNGIHSLFLLSMSDELPGLNDWVIRTVDQLPADLRRRNAVVTVGLHYAIVPDRSWSSFPAYVEHLAAMDPVELRDKLLRTYTRIPKHMGEKHIFLEDGEPLDVGSWLESRATFLASLRERFDESHINEEVETEAFSYLTDPPAMQSLIVDHMADMWDRYLAAEWQRTQPMLMDSIRAFRETDFSEMSNIEAARFITGDPLDSERWQRALERAGQVIFVPSPHVGPYRGRYDARDTLWVLFGARLPSASGMQAHELSRAGIIVQLGALTDDTRLQILRMVADAGELRSQEIIERLGISQSAVSRHLTQLVATGYLSERRCDGSKCYQLSPARIEETLAAVSRYLLGDQVGGPSA